MFKKFVKAIAKLNSREQADSLWFEIDIAYQHEKISWADHQMLFAIIDKLAF